MLLQPEQIQKVAATFIRIANLAAAGNSVNVTNAITTALGSAGNGGVQVPLQVSPDNYTEGVITAQPSNRVLVYDHATQKKLTDANGNEVFGRMTDNGSGVYTLSFFSLNNAGVETALAVNQSIDFEFAYRFTFEHLPADFAILVMERNVSEDPSPNNTKFADIWELLTITAQNTFNPLTFAPTSPTDITINANGKGEDAFAGGAFSVNVATKAITWQPANAGYNVKTTYRCLAVYKTQLS